MHVTTLPRMLADARALALDPALAATRPRARILGWAALMHARGRRTCQTNLAILQRQHEMGARAMPGMLAPAIHSPEDAA